MDPYNAMLLKILLGLAVFQLGVLFTISYRMGRLDAMVAIQNSRICGLEERSSKNG